MYLCLFASNMRFHFRISPLFSSLLLPLLLSIDVFDTRVVSQRVKSLIREVKKEKWKEEDRREGEPAFNWNWRGKYILLKWTKKFSKASANTLTDRFYIDMCLASELQCDSHSVWVALKRKVTSSHRHIQKRSPICAERRKKRRRGWCENTESES